MRCSYCKKNESEVEFTPNPRECKPCKKERSHRYYLRVIKPRKELAKMTRLHSVKGNWKPIQLIGEDYPGYFISDQGGIFGQRGNLMRPAPDGGGYPHVIIRNANGTKVVKIHHLVMEAFVGPKPNKMQVNHKDGEKMNNKLSNLEYVSASENMKHSLLIGQSNSKLSVDDMAQIIILRNRRFTFVDIGQLLGVSSQTASRIYRGSEEAE